MTPLWTPTPAAIATSHIRRFCDLLAERHGVTLADSDALYRFSVEQPEPFWATLWDYAGVRASQRGETVLSEGQRMPGARWFPDSRLNYAENLLRRRDDTTALVFRGEDKVSSRLSWAELYEQVERVAAALRRAGVGPGDRVAGFLPNLPEAVVAMLAATSLGAIWSSCSPDFGEQGVLDRFGQIEPKVLFCADGYFYNGKTIDSLPRIVGIAAALPSLRQVVVVGYTRPEDSLDLASIPVALPWRGFCVGPAEPLTFAQLPFDHPLFILYSSGTTGVPKCIVHSAGGTLLQHLKEHLLHGDLNPGERLFYFTTCGWMMWNWLVSALACEATLLLFDGSPFAPGPEVLWRYARDERCQAFGTSAKYLSALEKTGFKPRELDDLADLKVIYSTGSPLLPESYDYVYRDIRADVRLCSISGGTDIVSCFVLGNPTKPVWRGEIQQRGFGMAVEVFDDEGRPLRGEKGELVCTKPFPSMPVGFWNDPDGAKYRAAYFERFPNIWCHGDWAELTEHDGVIIHGRSDTVLNPGGVRIGTAEIYRQVETFPEVLESMAVGQDWDGDVRVVLFVRLRPDVQLDEALAARIKQKIRDGASPRHVPAKLIAVADIPRTISGKIVELAVRNVIHGRPVKNQDALANPEALKLFENLPQLRD
ncbi:acetoacetate--CoA ligase [Chitinimonas lacunae]|uniref:Acetoacetate--CoA ligase n=1 Tax=Chitinimonas lacunae TaxID=1963018 RepID=A0ABV8MQX8_9NEIS